MKTRREFLTTGAAFITALPVFDRTAVSAYDVAKAAEINDTGLNLVRDGVEFADNERKRNVSPVLREEILDNPEAVFIINTGVKSAKEPDGKFPAETEQFTREGYNAARNIFRKGLEKGGQTYIEPNFVGGFNADQRSLNNGVSTHPSFVAGFCDGLKEMGNDNIVVGANGAATHEDFRSSGVCGMLGSRGVCFTEGKYKSYSDYVKKEITWVDNPDGIVMKKVPFFSLTKRKDTTFINMAKDRIHNLGVTTLSIKNLQGIMPVGYMHVCGGWPTDLNRGTEKNVFNPDFRRKVEELYIKHARMGYKYWDEYGFAKSYFDAGGMEAFNKGDFKPDYKVFWFEQWAQRIMDIASNINPTVNMVEGIVGIDGADKLYLNNFITVSRSMVSNDAVASWMMGHDPRELFYLRIAKERGLGENDIEKIRIYEIAQNGNINKIENYRDIPRAEMGVNLFNMGKELLYF